MSDTNFLLIKFPPGAAGKMLISLLGYHPQIASWNNTQDSEEVWFKKHFNGELNNWMNTEPQSPWPISEYVSAMYTRGDETDNLPIQFPKNVFVPIIWHKLYPPKFAKKYKSVVILVDKKSRKWYHRSRWLKHFNYEKQAQGYKIYKLQHRPTYQFGNFDNQYIEYTDNIFSFLKQNVINYDQKKIYSSQSNFSNETVFINLSDLLENNSAIECLNKITQNLNLDTFNWNSVMPLWQHWRNLHKY